MNGASIPMEDRMRTPTRICTVALLCAATTLAGCAEMTSIYHSRSIPTPPSAMTVDSYQRNAYFSTVDGVLRVCAEAAPDTFAAISASLAAKADVATKSGELAAAISQSGATIERTQTINLLRESMYRTCERYLSKGIGPEGITVQAARDSRAMVAVLAIEQLTRTARPPAIVLSAGKTSASLPNDEAIEEVKAFREERDAAEGSRKEAQKTFDEADKSGKCSTTETKPADDTGDPKKSDWEKCDEARATLKLRESEVKKAEERLGKVIDLSGGNSGSGAITAATEEGPNNSGDGGSAPSDQAIGKVADAIRDIVLAPGIDEPLMFCIGHLGSSVAKAGSDVTGKCLEILGKRAVSDEQIRAKAFSLEVDGQRFNFDPFPEPNPRDTTLPRLEAYLSATDKKEAARRLAIATKAAKGLNMPTDPGALVLFATIRATPEERLLLLQAIRRNETNPAARAVLND
jgi:hypothetical protein